MIRLPQTLQAIERLLTLLQCDHCGAALHEPYTTGVCNHLLCSKCHSGENSRKYSVHCPVCSVPVRPRDFQLHPEIAQLVLVARRLKKLASTPTSEEIDPENFEKSIFETDLDAAMGPVFPSGGPTEEIYDDQKSKLLEPEITLLRSHSSASSTKNVPSPPLRRPSVVLKRGLPINSGSYAAETESVCTDTPAPRNPSITYKPRLKRCKGDSLSSVTSEISVTKLPAYRRHTGPSPQGFGTSTRSVSSLGSFSTEKHSSVATSLSDMASGSMDVVLQAATHVLRTRQSSKRSALRDLTFSTNTTVSVPIASPEKSHLEDIQSPTPVKPKPEELASQPSATDQAGGLVNQEIKPACTSTRFSVQPETAKPNLRNRSSSNFKGAKPDLPKPSGFSRFMRKLRPNGKGESVLHRAAIRGNVEQVQNYLNSGLSPDLRDHAGWTPLHEAVFHGHVKVAEALLKSGATVDIPGGPDLDTPLHDAIQNAQSACCELLLAYGASPILPNGSGLTPVQLVDSCLNKLAAFNPTPKRQAAESNQKRFTTFNSLQTIRTALLKVVLQHQSTSVPKTEPDFSKALLPDGSAFIERRRLRPVLLSTGLSRPQQATFTRVAAMIHAQVVNVISPEVTHVITGAIQEAPSTGKKPSNHKRTGSGDCGTPSSIQQTSCPRTLKFLNAVLLGCWILSFDWIETCAHVKMRVEEEGFEVTGCSTTPLSGAPRRARLSREAGSLGLFYRFRLCFLGEFVYPVPSSKDLAILARSGGATVVFCRERCSPLRLARLAVEMNDNSGPPDWELIESPRCIAEDAQEVDGDDDENTSTVNHFDALSPPSSSPLLVIYSVGHKLDKSKPCTSIPYAVQIVSQAMGMLRPCSDRANLSDPPLKAVPSNWLLDCAAEHCILPESLT